MANSRFDSLVAADQIDQSAETAGWYYASPAGGIVSSTADVTAKAASAGFRHYVTGCTLTADALSAANELVIKDGASTVMARVRIQTSGLPNGLDISFEGAPLRGSSGNAIIVALTGSTTGGVVVNLRGFTGKN